MQENGYKVRRSERAKVNRFGKMVQLMKECGVTIKQMVMAE